MATSKSNPITNTSQYQIHHLLVGNELHSYNESKSDNTPCIQISTIFKNNSNPEHQTSTIAKLKSRMLEIIEKNHWLMGRIRHCKKVDMKTYHLSKGRSAPRTCLALCVKNDENSPEKNRESYIKETVNDQLFSKPPTYTQ